MIKRRKAYKQWHFLLIRANKTGAAMQLPSGLNSKLSLLYRSLSKKYRHTSFLRLRSHYISRTSHWTSTSGWIFYENGSHCCRNERLFHKYYILPYRCTSLRLLSLPGWQAHNKDILAERITECKQKMKKF